jgi:hypothetical protein
VALAEADVVAQAEQAAALVGQSIVSVQYVTIDYFREERAPRTEGPRTVTEASEWAEPTWQTPACDSVDYGVELHLNNERVFSITWESPGPLLEGLRLLDSGVIGEGVLAGAATAIWDVSRAGWSEVRGRPISGVRLHHALWDPRTSQQWLPRLTIHVGGDVVDVFLGEGAPGDHEVRPSADNLAILFNPAVLPTWLKA